jgi:hypothetical protein
VNGEQFSYPTPQGYIDKLIALKAIRAYVRFDTHIRKFQEALKVWNPTKTDEVDLDALIEVARRETGSVTVAPQTTTQTLKLIGKIENPPWRTSGDNWTTKAVLTIYYTGGFAPEIFRGTTPADYIAKLQSIRSIYYEPAIVDRWIQEFQQAQNYWNLEILNRQLAAQQAAEAAPQIQAQTTEQTAAPSTAPAVAQPPTAVQFQPNKYPRTVNVNVSTLRVRATPYTTGALAGSQYLYNGDQFIVTGYVTGENVDGENRWWTTQFGNYVWVGGTAERP